MFDKSLYITEMTKLIDEACQRFVEEHPNVVVFTVAIWTDPGAAASAISFDTAAHSAEQMAQGEIWAKKHYDRLMAAGEIEQAKLFAPSKPDARNCSPADFKYRDYGELDNKAFPYLWNEKTEGKYWDELEPAILQVGEASLTILKQLKLHPRAELGMNGPRDWYEHTWDLGAS